MIFVIDTSSAKTAVALVDESGRARRQDIRTASRISDLPERYRSIAGGQKLTRVAVATGPGSFTGLRVGVSFGLGLAIGLEIPIVPLPTLGLQAARSDSPVIAVVEAGRGRVYLLPPGGQPALGEVKDLPRIHRLVGWVSPSTEAALLEAGHLFMPDHELRDFGEAAGRLLSTAREVPYGSLKLEYMQSFSVKK